MGAATSRAALARAGARTAAAARSLLTCWMEANICVEVNNSEAMIPNAAQINDLIECDVEAGTCQHYKHIQDQKRGQE